MQNEDLRFAFWVFRFAIPENAPCSLLAAALLRLPGQLPVRRRTLFPEGIETVYVPVFDSASYRRGFGEELTEAVVKEIESRTPYKVVSTPGGRYRARRQDRQRQTRQLIFETTTGDPRDTEIKLAVKVSWTDQRGRPVRDIPLVPVKDASVDDQRRQ